MNGDNGVTVERPVYGSPRWAEAVEFAENCSWIAGKHIASIMRENRMTEWETYFVAVCEGRIVGYCTFLREDYYPDKTYSPWISSVFVDENSRGHRVSHIMIREAEKYAASKGFTKVYIPSDMDGFYEKCGYTPVARLVNYGGDTDTVYMKELIPDT